MFKSKKSPWHAIYKNFNHSNAIHKAGENHLEAKLQNYYSFCALAFFYLVFLIFPVFS